LLIFNGENNGKKYSKMVAKGIKCGFETVLPTDEVAHEISACICLQIMDKGDTLLDEKREP